MEQGGSERTSLWFHWIEKVKLSDPPEILTAVPKWNSSFIFLLRLYFYYHFFWGKATC